jgi:hypothetical protein
VTGTLAIVFVGAAVICVIAGLAAVGRTRRSAREDEAEYGADDDEATYAEEAAAVKAAEDAAAAAARRAPEREPDDDVHLNEGPDIEYEGPHS